MCGIAGFESRDAHDEVVAARLIDALRSRGPDAQTSTARAGIHLVQTRLAVIDLSDRVRYPIPNEDETVRLLFNGEIYNHRELARELKGHGHRFMTSCDAEVVVHAWEEWGLAALPRLEGMFAIALLDERTGELVLARDRLGIKPLVFTTDESDRFAFASDAVALVTAGLSAGEPDRDVIDEFALLHYLPPPLTGISDLRQLEPGTALVRDRQGKQAINRFADPTFAGPLAEQEAAMEIDGALRESVHRQLAADVPVGVLLSGGIDSSLILSFAAEAGARPTAFTVGFAGHGGYDERPVAARLARSLGIPHVYEDLDLDFASTLAGVRDAYDVPFADSSAIATLQLARLARGEVTVVLSGTGGDDLFAGYYRHRAHLLLGALSRLPRPALRALERMPSRRGAERTSFPALAGFYLGRLGRAGTKDPWSQYLALLTDLTSDSGLELVNGGTDWSVVAQRIAARHSLGGERSGSTLRELQRFELSTYLPGDLLVKEDRATMAVGLEGRVPLLDHLVLEAAEATPDDRKISWRSGKRPLRKLARQRLPSAVGRSRKRGFAVPLADLLRGPWRAEAEEWAHSTSSDLVEIRGVPNLIDRDGGPADAWALLALAAWEQRLGAERRAATRPAPAGHGSQ